MKILFIDQNVKDYQVFVDGVNDSTLPIVYNYSTKIEDIVLPSQIDRIGFVFHGYSGFYSAKPFIEGPFFTLSSGNVSENAYIQFIITTYQVSHVDFLGCNLLLSEEWTKYFDLLSRYCIVGASNDNTGNLKYGGDWVLESTMEDIQNLYFSNIDNYSGLLALLYEVNSYYHTFYTVSMTRPAFLTRTIYDNSMNLQSTLDLSFGSLNAIDALKMLDSQPYTLGQNSGNVALDVAFCGAYSKALTTTQQRKLMTYVNTFKEPHTSAIVYTVTVVDGVFNLALNDTPVARRAITFNPGLYVFDQSDSSNKGNTLVIGSTVDSLPYASIVVSGTTGVLNAYTLLDLSVFQSLKYFSSNYPGMGTEPAPVLNFPFTSNQSNLGSLNVTYVANPGSFTSTNIGGKQCATSASGGLGFQFTGLNNYTNQNGYTFLFQFYMTILSKGMLVNLQLGTISNTRFFVNYNATGNVGLSVGFQDSSDFINSMFITANRWWDMAITINTASLTTIYLNPTGNALTKKTQNTPSLTGAGTAYRSKYDKIGFLMDFWDSGTTVSNKYIRNFLYYDSVFNETEIGNKFNSFD